MTRDEKRILVNLLTGRHACAGVYPSHRHLARLARKGLITVHRVLHRRASPRSELPRSPLSRNAYKLTPKGAKVAVRNIDLARRRMAFLRGNPKNHVLRELDAYGIEKR